MNGRKRSGRGRHVRLQSAGAVWGWLRVQSIVWWHWTYERLHPWQPVVLVDAKRKRARQVRGAIVRAARAYVNALGVPPPERLLVVVQRLVVDQEPVHALLQVFADRDGTRRHVMFLALSVQDRAVSADELVGTFRQHLRYVLGDAIGELTANVPFTAPATPSTRAIILPQHHAFEPDATASDWESPLPNEDSMPTRWHENGAYADASR